MRKQLLLLAIFTIVTAASAFAINLKVDIPFDFAAAEKTLPAGEYLITGTYGITQIQGIHHHSNVFVLSDYAERTRIPKVTAQWTPEAAATSDVSRAERNTGSTSDSKYILVVFRKYGEKYFLSSIWSGFQGREFQQTKMESELNRASLSTEPEIVVLSARIR